MQGTGLDQFNYHGTGWSHCTICETGLFNNSNSWDNTVNDSVTLSFAGTQIKFYGVKDPGHGIGAASVDGGKETNVDFYAALRAGNQLLWTSPVLAKGTHNFKLRVTGTKNPSSANTWVAIDRAYVIDTSGTTGVNSSTSLLKDYNLFQNYPNPFNPSTIIQYQLPANGMATIKVFDVLGREIITLVNGYKAHGIYTISFDAKKLTSGIYFYQLRSGNFISTKKMIVMK
jgi:hypothetical protein